MRNRSYSADPHWVSVRYPCNCRICDRKIQAGETAWYWPASRSMDCRALQCGTQSAMDFQTAKQDEEFLVSQFGGR